MDWTLVARVTRQGDEAVAKELQDMTGFRENKDVRRPFASTPDARIYFPASAIEKARLATGRCLRRDEGVALVIGGPGVGKTLLSRVLASEFENDDLVAYVSASRKMNVKSFLQQLLFGLRQTFVGADETELRLMTFDYLERSSYSRFALLIDDAQNLTLRVYDEIRALADRVAAPTQTCVALFGTPALEERLNLPILFPFQQRIVSRAYLDNFTEQEASDYITRELTRANVAAQFTEDARRAIAQRSNLTPRVVAQLCDRALFLAQEKFSETSNDNAETLEITERDAERAWRDLQSLVENESDFDEIVPGASATDVVEFGELSDDDDDDDSTIVENASDEIDAPTIENDGPVAVVDEGAARSDESENEPEENLEEIDEPIEESGEIDSELDARLRAMCDGVANDQEVDETESTVEENAMKFEIHSTTEGISRTTTSARRRREDATYLRDARPEDDSERNGLYDASLSFDSDGVASYAANPPSVTRRPIEGDVDGSQEYRRVNGFNAEDGARFAADDRHLESQFEKTADGAELRDWSADNRYDSARALEDRAYRQIVASCYRSVSDFPASDQYLNELRLLEQEIAEEANLIRRIRHIHLQLRAARDPLGRSGQSDESTDATDAFLKK